MPPMRRGYGLVRTMVSGRFLTKRGFITLIQRDNPSGKGMIYTCPKCLEEFTMYKRLKAHRKEVHAY